MAASTSGRVAGLVGNWRGAECPASWTTRTGGLIPAAGDHAMEKTTAIDAAVPLLGEDWFDPLEAGVRQQIRSFIEQMLEAELEAALNRRRYERAGPAAGHRHGHRERQIIGTFGPTAGSVPRARLVEADGTTREWRNRTLPACKRLTRRAEALIAGSCLAGTNTRRVRRALGTLFGGAVGKDTVSRAWRKCLPSRRRGCRATGRRGRSAIWRTTTSCA